MNLSEMNKDLHALPDSTDVNNTQRVCAYLRNLRERLQQTILQHTDLIQTSLSIVREMTDVSTTLALAPLGPEQQYSKIKHLIMEFENMHTGDTDMNSSEAMELRNLLSDFRRVNESQLLRDSLMCFNRAKESFEKVKSLLDNDGQGKATGSGQPSPQSSQQAALDSQSRSLREKIQAFNMASANGQNAIQTFNHCFSSTSSTNIASGDDMKLNQNGSRSLSNSGYEGDVDSEIDAVDSLNSAQPGDKRDS